MASRGMPIQPAKMASVMKLTVADVKRSAGVVDADDESRTSHSVTKRQAPPQRDERQDWALDQAFLLHGRRAASSRPFARAIETQQRPNLLLGASDRCDTDSHILNNPTHTYSGRNLQKAFFAIQSRARRTLLQ